jgi:hypothetical protein
LDPIETNNKKTKAALNEYSPKRFRVSKLIQETFFTAPKPMLSPFNPNSTSIVDTRLEIAFVTTVNCAFTCVLKNIKIKSSVATNHEFFAVFELEIGGEPTESPIRFLSMASLPLLKQL